MSARIEPERGPFAPEIQSILDQIGPPGTSAYSLFTTLARNPRVFQKVMASGMLEKNSITLRERQIIIARTTARCDCEYQWAVHIANFAGAASLTGRQIVASVNGPANAPAWNKRETLLVRLVDSLHTTAHIDDTLWKSLKAEFSDAQLIECIVLTGFYHTISFVANALRLPLENNGVRFPGQPRPPTTSTERLAS